MAEIIFNCEFVKTQFAQKNGNTFKKINTDEMIDYYDRKEACDYTEISDEDDSFNVDTNKAFNYYNYRIGSSGGFNKNGSLKKGMANKLVNKYKPNNMYRMVFSFEKEFLEENNFIQKSRLQELITKSMDKNIRLMGLNPDNCEWGCYYHTNTEHPHCHIWLFEKNATKDYLKIQKKQFAKMRSNIVRNMLIDSDIYARRDEQRDKLISTIKRLHLNENKLKATFNNSKKSFKEDDMLFDMIISLEKVIPKDGSLKYNSKNIRPYHEEIEKIVTYILENNVSDYYNKYLSLLNQEKNMFNKRYFSNNEKMKKNNFIDNKEKELHDRIANMILQNIKAYRNDVIDYKKNNDTKTINIQDTILNKYSEEIGSIIDWNDADDTQKYDEIIDSLKKSIMQRLSAENEDNTIHSMKARSAILNAGVLDELAHAINEASIANTIIEKELQSMIDKAHQENKRKYELGRGI
ncbi:MAG: relaxase MobL [Thomasclavelia ramosa]